MCEMKQIRAERIAEAEKLITGKEYLYAIEILEPLVMQDSIPEEHSLLCEAYLSYIMCKFHYCIDDVEYLRDVANGIYFPEDEESIWDRMKSSEEEGASMLERALRYFGELKGTTKEAENDQEILDLIYRRIQYIVHELGPEHYNIGSGNHMRKLDEDAEKYFQGKKKEMINHDIAAERFAELCEIYGDELLKSESDKV